MQSKSRQALPPLVEFLALVSFFSDLASGMVTPLIPVLLAARQLQRSVLET